MIRDKTILKILSKQKYFSIRAEGTSMLPTLIPGDIVNLRKTGIEKVKVNDIVLVFKKNRFFVHRLIHKRGKTIVTRGDHNLSSDGQFRERNLLGKVVGVKRGNNRINIENMNLIQSTLYFAEAV